VLIYSIKNCCKSWKFASLVVTLETTIVFSSYTCNSTPSTTSSVSTTSMDTLATVVEAKLPVFKIVIFGDSGIGKTSLVARLVSPNRPNHDIRITMGIEFDTQIFDTGNGRVKAQIWDIAGQERFARVLLPAYFRKAKGIILVYDITDTKSFESLRRRWIPTLKKHGPSVYMIKLLVGNKCDQEASREVSREKAQLFCNEYDMELVETSALNGENVLKAFEKIIVRIHNNLLLKKILVESGLSTSDQNNVLQKISELGYNDYNPETWAGTKGVNGRLPFITAAAKSLKWPCMKVIFNLNMPAIYEIDVLTGMPLFMLAAAGANSDIEAIYSLLKEHPAAISITSI